MTRFLTTVVMVAALLLPGLASAQTAGAVSGRVVDAAGAPVPDALVSLPEFRLRTVTKADGTFSFGPLAPGRYTLSVRRSGYAPAVVTFEAPPSTALSVALQTTPFEISRLDVTASRSPIDSDRSPLPTAALSGDKLRREHSVSLARAIEDLPGVRTLSTGEQVGKPVIRGLSGPRVLTLEDGYRLEDYSWSDEDCPSVDARLTDRIEVVRGPASVLYGSDALGGVVNAVPADLPDARGGSSISRAGVEAYFASNNAEFGSALRFEHATGNFGGRVFIVGRKGADLHTPDGEIPNTGFGGGSGEVALGLRGASGGATLRFSSYGGEFKLLEADAPPPSDSTAKEEEGGPERKTSDNRLQLGGNLLVGGLRLESKAQFQQHSLIEVADAFDSSGTKTEGDQFHLLLSTYELDLMAHHGAGHEHGTFGVSGMAQKNDSKGPIPLVPDARIVTGAAFALEQVDRGRFSFLGGARVERRHTETDDNVLLALPDLEHNDVEGSADLGLVYRLQEGLSLALNGGRGWRAPSLFERYANGPHVGEARYELGDPDLVPERGLEFDAGLRVSRPRVRLELTGFHHAIDNFIFIAPTGTNRVVGADTLALYQYEQADARLTGGELWGQLEAATALTLRARADYVSGQNRELDVPLPLIPPFRSAIEAEVHSDKLHWAQRASFGVEVEHIADQTRLGPNDVPTGAYALVHLDGGVKKQLGGRTYQLDLRVRNLADKAYRSFLSRYKEFALDPGRNIVVRLSTGL